MNRGSNLPVLTIVVSILLFGCRGENASSYIPPSTTCQESSSKSIYKKEQLESPYLSTISKEEFDNRFYSTYSSSMYWLNENELLVQGAEDQNGNLEFAWSTTSTDTWQPNMIFKENDTSYLVNVIKLRDDTYATKLNGDYIIFDEKYNITNKKYFNAPDTLAAIFNPTNDTLYYYENGGVFAESSSGKRLVYSLPSQWQESGYIRAITLSPSYEKVAFSVILEPAYSVLTVILDTNTDMYNEIDVKMNMPSYFWMDGELFAIENVDDKQSYCNIYYGENLSQVKVIDRNLLAQNLGLSLLPEEAGDWGYIHYDTKPENLGGNDFGIPLIADYSDETDKRASALLLLQKKNDQLTISLLEHGDEMYTELLVSPEGKKILFRKWGDKNITNAYYVLPIY